MEHEHVPRDPLTGMAEAAASLHELFLSMVEAEFTEWQACRILGVMLAEQNRQQ
jgi:hypothetical protein